MNKIFCLILLVLLSACHQRVAKTEGINFNECNFYYENQNKWISTTNDAKQFLELDSALLTNPTYVKQLDSTYSKKAQYIFIIGGGYFYAQAKEMKAEIKHDTLYIIWNEPNGMCPPTGERSQTNMCLEIDKVLYPNYKNFKIVISQQ
ncbi:hypothetical protein EZ449_03560 [Pedobacter frigidisoli]|uniref:Lipoprotein n=1 Tax=Pedobacter frigidisoli TaxID=2530455 RepID=A0A4R0P636_9SPHI|nr:hypothetical protein [Pedobacter frigidisoli]TCD12107.1 hypothetical protein EZ449_03560 [Pedobacter frigidisoli]